MCINFVKHRDFSIVSYYSGRDGCNIVHYASNVFGFLLKHVSYRVFALATYTME